MIIKTWKHFTSKYKITAKQISKSAGAIMGWLMIFILALTVGSYAFTFIGIWNHYDMVWDAISVLLPMKDMTVLSYFDNSFFSFVMTLTDSDIEKLSVYLLTTMAVSYAFILIGAVIINSVKHNIFYKVKLRKLFLVMTVTAITNVIAERLVMLTATEETLEDIAAATLLSMSGGPFLTIVIIGIFAPIVEELIFRRGIQHNLSKIHPALGIILTSISFGVVHGNFLQALFATIMGMLLGVVYEMSKNISYTIAMHMAVNIPGALIGAFDLNETLIYVIEIIVLCICTIMAYKIHLNKHPEIISENGGLKKALKIYIVGKKNVKKQKTIQLTE